MKYQLPSRMWTYGTTTVTFEVGLRKLQTSGKTTVVPSSFPWKSQTIGNRTW